MPNVLLMHWNQPDRELLGFKRWTCGKVADFLEAMYSSEILVDDSLTRLVVENFLLSHCQVCTILDSSFSLLLLHNLHLIKHSIQSMEASVGVPLFLCAMCAIFDGLSAPLDCTPSSFDYELLTMTICVLSTEIWICYCLINPLADPTDYFVTIILCRIYLHYCRKCNCI